jgi:hypothetical protein
MLKHYESLTHTPLVMAGHAALKTSIAQSEHLEQTILMGIAAAPEGGDVAPHFVMATHGSLRASPTARGHPGGSTGGSTFQMQTIRRKSLLPMRHPKLKCATAGLATCTIRFACLAHLAQQRRATAVVMVRGFVV